MSNLIVHPNPDQIQAYYDQDLDQETASSFQRHLDICQDCRAELARLEALAARLEALPQLPLERDFSLEVLSRLKGDQKLSSGITWILLGEVLAAGAVISALIPVIQATSWLSSLVNTRRELLAGINIFLAQLASTWMIWWAKLQLNFKWLLESFQIPAGLPSAWILVLSAGGLVILLNFLLLQFKPFDNQNLQG